MASIYIQNSIILGSSELVELFRKYAPEGLILRSNTYKFTIYYDITAKRYIYHPDSGRIAEMKGVWNAMSDPHTSFIVKHPPLYLTFANFTNTRTLL